MRCRRGAPLLIALGLAAGSAAGCSGSAAPAAIESPAVAPASRDVTASPGLATPPVPSDAAPLGLGAAEATIRAYWNRYNQGLMGAGAAALIPLSAEDCAACAGDRADIDRLLGKQQRLRSAIVSTLDISVNSSVADLLMITCSVDRNETDLLADDGTWLDHLTSPGPATYLFTLKEGPYSWLVADRVLL